MTMMRSLLLLLVALAASAAAASAVQDAPFVVAHKKVALSRPGPGVERLAVTLDLYNQGSVTAYDVSLNDDSWPQEAFQLISGTTSKIVDKLDPGATASHNFILETKTQGKFQGSPAIIRYRVPTKAALQEAYSTPMFPLDILAERPPQQKFEWAKRLVGKYGPLVSVVSFVGVFVYLVASPSKSAAAKSKKKR
ncbi:translocon-associated protein subunit beta-like [Oryza brachyantha]|uniref:translocon-associated protein subunit beta-like n=1 Tax=Oryza brachyantha TaxID=4533 RepID=UPI0003EAE1D2|nr:translocon-associated protein subunit beta-like [Oryza brachyantha]